MTVSRRALATAGLFVAAAAVYSIRLSAPFDHYHENVAACYANWGRNSLRLGLGASGGAPVRAVDPLADPRAVKPDQLYSHRPPTVSLIVALSFRLFGPCEAAVRGVGVLATLGTLAAFLALSSRLLGPSWGPAAAAIFAFVPGFAFYGPAIAHQTFGILGALLILLAYLRWKEAPSPKRLAALAATAVLACGLDWPAFYGAGAAGLLHLLTSRERRAIALVPPGAALLAFALFIFYLYLLDPRGGVPLRDFLQTGAAHRGRAPLGPYLAGHLREALRGFTIPLLALAVLGCTRLRPRADFSDAAILSTALLGADAFLFPSLSYGHFFMNVPWSPFLALASARGLQRLAAPGWPRIAAGALLAGFAIQSAVALARDHGGGRFPYYAEASRGLAAALRLRTLPEERTLVRVYVDPHLLAYYADRRIAVYSRGTIASLETAVSEGGLDEEALIRRLEAPGHGFSWFVTTSVAAASERLSSVRALRGAVPDPDAWARDAYEFESEREPSKLVAFLRSRHPEIRVDGFLFFDLRSAR